MASSSSTTVPSVGQRELDYSKEFFKKSFAVFDATPAFVQSIVVRDKDGIDFRLERPEITFRGSQIWKIETLARSWAFNGDTREWTTRPTDKELTKGRLAQLVLIDHFKNDCEPFDEELPLMSDRIHIGPYDMKRK